MTYKRTMRRVVCSKCNSQNVKVISDLLFCCDPPIYTYRCNECKNDFQSSDLNLIKDVKDGE